MSSMRRISAALLASFIFTCASSPAALCAEEGKLGSFEKELSEPEGENSPPESSSSIDAASIAAEGVMSILMQFFMMGLMTSGMEGSADLYRELKHEWHPAMPTIRVEPAYQWMSGNINGFSGKLEAGYLIFGVDGEVVLAYVSGANQLDERKLARAAGGSEGDIATIVGAIVVSVRNKVGGCNGGLQNIWNKLCR